MDYTPHAISDQIVACRELGIEEYLIWATNNTYDPGIFNYEHRIDDEIRSERQDLLDQTPEEALERFLSAQYHERTITQYLMTPREDRAKKYEDFLADIEEQALVLTDYTVAEEQSQGEGDTVTLRAHVLYESEEGVADVTDAAFEIIRENDVWKVRMPVLRFEEPATEEEPEPSEEEPMEETESED